jgi:hypothetical protein
MQIMVNTDNQYTFIKLFLLSLYLSTYLIMQNCRQNVMYRPAFILHLYSLSICVQKWCECLPRKLCETIQGIHGSRQPHQLCNNINHRQPIALLCPCFHHGATDCHHKMWNTDQNSRSGRSAVPWGYQPPNENFRFCNLTCTDMR